MRDRGAWARSAIVVGLSFLLLMTGGCGLLRTQGPPTGHEHMTYFSCTESNAGPIVDFVLGGLQVLTTASMLSGEDGPYSGDQNDAFTLTSGAVWTALFTTSGILGLKKTARCREARELLASRLAAGGTAGKPADPTLLSVRVDPPRTTIAVGEQVQLSATALNSSQVGVLGRSFLWTSSDDAVASVSSVGLVTAKAEGRVIIAANTGGVVGTAEVVVEGGAFLGTTVRLEAPK